MEAVETTLAYTGDHRADTGAPYGRKLPPRWGTPRSDGDDDDDDDDEDEEPTYVDLVHIKAEPCARTVKVTFTGEGNQRAVIKCDGGGGTLAPIGHPGSPVLSEEHLQQQEKRWDGGVMTVTGEPPLEETRLRDDTAAAAAAGSTRRVDAERVDPLRDGSTCSAPSEDLEYTDMCLRSKTASDNNEEEDEEEEEEEDNKEEDDNQEEEDEEEEEEDSEVLSEQRVAEDESHYITTHEIQLTELDHDVDSCDRPGRGSGGDCEDDDDDNLVYTFVDYALFESDETHGDAPGGGGGTRLLNVASSHHQYHQGGVAAGPRGGVGGAEPESDSDAGSSDDSVGKHCAGGGVGGGVGVGGHQERLIHLSIPPAPRGTEGGSARTFAANHGGVCCGGHARPAEYRGRGFLTHVNPRGCDFIPPPGRQHLATKLRWKDVNSSGASSSISELDDADKEVRNLTAKTFRSLACPYFDAINLGTSSESSSVSEYGLGLNKWSAYVNVNHGGGGGNNSRPRGRGIFTQNSSSATIALNKAGDGTHGMESHAKMYATNTHVAPAKQAAAAAASSSSNTTLTPEQPHWGDVITTLTETINFHVEAELPESRRHSTCRKHGHGGACTKEGGAKGNTQKRATLASSHLKNVISKKMQFEHERQLERGDRAMRSPCPQCREQELSQARGPHGQFSEAGSEITVNSLDEIGFEGLRPHSCEAKEEKNDAKGSPERGAAEKADSVEVPKAQLNRSHCSAFTLLKAEPPSVRGALAAATSAQGGAQGSGVVNKLSHLFVPDLSVAVAHGAKEPPGTDRKEVIEKVAKPPEIKICLRSAKENHGHMLNIANLLTPKISNTVKTLKTTGYSRLQVLSAPDRIPHFTVRDMRENKCKFQMPIYHVRDVRKLVKSSYNFVATDSGDNKCPTSAAAAAAATTEVYEDMRKKEPVKHVSPSPIFIKCNSVKTNGSNGQQPPGTGHSESSQQQKPTEASRFSPKGGECSSSHWSGAKGTPATPKQANPEPQREKAERPAGDASERKNDPKVPNQAALEKLQAAVKTMEQLYVFDRNEWKRRSHAVPPQQPVNQAATQQPTVNHTGLQQQPVNQMGPQKQLVNHTGPQQQSVSHAAAQPQTVSHSHVLSLSTSRAAPDKDSKGVIHVPVNRDPIRTQPQLSKTYCKKSVLHLDKSKKIPVNIRPQNQGLSQASCTLQRAKMPGAPQLFKIEVPKDGRQVDQGKAPTANSSPTTAAAATPSNAVDPGNYLTIPRQGYTSEIQLLHPPNTKGDATATKPNTGKSQRPECAQTHPVVLQNHPTNTDCPPATIYHHPRHHNHHHQLSSASPPQGLPPQPRLLRFSPSTSSASPSPGSEPPQTQRKMLLDITTGYYYLVDTPVQPATKRLFDPETGRYVDVPMSHSPVTPIPLSPLTLSPGAYGATPAYMIYPGLMVPPSPTLAPKADALLLPPAAGPTSGLPIPPFSSPSSSPGKHGQQQEVGTAGAESPYYSATREAAHMPSLQVPAAEAGAGGHVTSRGGGGAGGTSGAERKPVISITTQQGPRIIAPPSFDGTTMSFVVEHR